MLFIGIIKEELKKDQIKNLMDPEKQLQMGPQMFFFLSKEHLVFFHDSLKVYSFGGDEISQVPMVITAQSVPGFEEGPVLQTISIGGEAMLSVLSAVRSARGHGSKQRGFSQISQYGRLEGLLFYLARVTALCF